MIPSFITACQLRRISVHGSHIYRYSMFLCFYVVIRNVEQLENTDLRVEVLQLTVLNMEDMEDEVIMSQRLTCYDDISYYSPKPSMLKSLMARVDTSVVRVRKFTDIYSSLSRNLLMTIPISISCFQVLHCKVMLQNKHPNLYTFNFTHYVQKNNLFQHCSQEYQRI